MNLADFDYLLPEHLIAQTPLTQRTASRLLVLRRNDETITHARFTDLPGLLREGDLLVRNDTRVLPARLLGRKESGGRCEVLLVRPDAAGPQVWECMTRSSKPLRSGNRVVFDGGLKGEVVEVREEGLRSLRFYCDGDFSRVLEQVGHMPLPPYIRREDVLQDRERYQTVFATRPGAVAAPTAGLHFSDETFAELTRRGVEVCSVTLHVGPGTFQPPRSDDLASHRMHAEAFEVPEETARRVNAAKGEGRRVVALGTTVTRTLEHAVDEGGALQDGSGETDLFIRPGFDFRVVDALITNFHLPKSTLLVLVSAFAGREFALRAYREAVDRDYRFFSYGDCMLIE